MDQQWKLTFPETNSFCQRPSTFSNFLLTRHSNKKLLGAKGIATRSDRTLLGASGITIRNKNATSSFLLLVAMHLVPNSKNATTAPSCSAPPPPESAGPLFARAKRSSKLFRSCTSGCLVVAGSDGLRFLMENEFHLQDLVSCEAYFFWCFGSSGKAFEDSCWKVKMVKGPGRSEWTTLDVKSNPFFLEPCFIQVNIDILMASNLIADETIYTP